MSAALETGGTMLSFSPGAGIAFDASGAIQLDLAALAGGADFSVTATTAEGTPLARYRVLVTAEALTAVTRFDAPNKLDRVTFLSTVAPNWTQQDGCARLIPAATARAHGAWADAQGDGVYRCLFRLKGGLPAAIDRRFTFGARIRLAEANWHGVRVELFETAAGERRIHIREYTGVSGITTSLATTPVAWGYDEWHWLEVSVAGATVRGRVYAEGAIAPAWQVEASTRQVEDGDFGPGGFPASGQAPVIDIRQLEYSPA